MTANPDEPNSERSLEQLADRRSSKVEFTDVMDLLRASPRTRDIPADDLEKRARAAWEKFENAPVRSFVPILVEREVLRGLPSTPDSEDD
jgi:hypothetical protein